MTIVHLCRTYHPHIGGVETHVAEISRQFIADGHRVVILTTQDRASEPLTEVVDGATVVRQPVTGVDKKLATWKWIASQMFLLDAADIIQVHDVGWWLMPFWPLIEDKAYITFHGWETQYPVRWQAKLQRWVMSVLSRGRVHVGDWIREFYWDKPTAVTYGGVRPPKNDTLINKSIKKTLTITFIGRLAADNNIKLYIQFLTLLKEKGWKLSVHWIGDGPERSTAQSIGKVWGIIANPERHLAQSDVVLASSYLAILQAQSLGKIVCSFYDNPLKQRYLETYPANDLLLISDSAQIMAEKVSALFENVMQRRQIQEQARRFAQTRSWNSVVAMYYRLWSE